MYFTADVYYVKTSDMTLKWARRNPSLSSIRSAVPGATAMIGNGNFILKVKDPWRFLQAMDAFRDVVRFPQIRIASTRLSVS